MVSQQSWNVFNGNGYAPVAISPGGYADAGGFALQGNLNGTGTEAFVAFCLDVMHDLRLPSYYSTTDTPFDTATGGVHLNSTQQSDIQTLFNAYYGPSLLTNNAADAGFQVALWEIVNEHTNATFSLNSGSFTATTLSGYSHSHYSADAIKQATAYLTAINDNNAPVHFDYRLTYLQSINTDCKPGCYCWQPSQNLVTVSAVPLPATGFLLLSAVGGFGFASRRRRRRA